MIVEEITQIGNPLLFKKSKIVKDIGSEQIQRIIKDMIDSMYHYNLIGIAAPQIGEDVSIFITEIRKTRYRNLRNDGLRIYINPKITYFSEETVKMFEGCGSVAYSQLFAPVKRPRNIKIEAFDEKAKKFKFEADAMLSRVIQHEFDHLKGILFVEKVESPKLYMSRSEYEKRINK